MQTLLFLASFLPSTVIQPFSLQDISAVKNTPYYQMSRIVAHQKIENGGFYCSGFRLGERLFISNLHCYMRAPGKGAMVMGRESGSSPMATFPIDEVLVEVRDLDLVLLRVQAAAPLNSKFPRARLFSGTLKKDTPLILPSHAGVQSKQIDVSPQCKLTNEIPFFKHERINIQHQCDTMGGSSGSPMIERTTGNVLGLHWGGMDGSGHNHGISMPMILEFIKKEMPHLLPELDIVN